MNVGLLGAGHIARALAQGWSGAVLKPARLAFYDVDGERATALAAETGGEAASTAASLVAGADIVIVAVRPQDVDGVLREVGEALGERVLVSVAAGVPLARLTAALPSGARVARVMPNVAAALGLGVFLLVPGTLDPAGVSAVTELFGAAGTVVRLSEDRFDAGTSVAGCMPGLLAAVVTAFAAAAEAEGIAPETARTLAVEGVHGAAALIAREGDPAAVMAAAATPGGMTAAGVTALEERGLAPAVKAAVRAATARAQALA